MEGQIQPQMATTTSTYKIVVGSLQKTYEASILLAIQAKQTLLCANVQLDNALGAWHQVPRHVQYNEYCRRVKFFQRQDTGFQRYVEHDNANYFTEDGVCDAAAQRCREH